MHAHTVSNCRCLNNTQPKLCIIIALERVTISRQQTTPPPSPKQCPKTKDHAQQNKAHAQTHYAGISIEFIALVEISISYLIHDTPHRRGIKVAALYEVLFWFVMSFHCDKWYASFAIVFIHKCIFFHPIIIISDRTICAVCLCS